VATIRERRPAVFEVRVFVGRDERGKPVQTSRTIYGSKKDARRAADELGAAALVEQATRTTFDRLLDLRVESSEASWAPSTVDSQRSRVALTKRSDRRNDVGAPRTV
jgi:hypothetical protein